MVASRFIDPIARLSKASAVLVPAIADIADINSLSEGLDGLLLTGSRSNVSPAIYGGLSSDQPIDEERDEVALRLAARMIELGKPVFGICRGLQEINVLFGGSLRDLEGEKHHAPEQPGRSYESLFDHRHRVNLESYALLNDRAEQRRVSVSSVHRQGIDALGTGLDIEALSDDGLIEAVSSTSSGAVVLGVQWHPEVALAECDVSRAFFERLQGALHAYSA